MFKYVFERVCMSGNVYVYVERSFLYVRERVCVKRKINEPSNTYADIRTLLKLRSNWCVRGVFMRAQQSVFSLVFLST